MTFETNARPASEAVTPPRARAVASPVGPFSVWLGNDGSLRSGWSGIGAPASASAGFDESPGSARSTRDDRLLDRAVAAIEAYFKGNDTALAALPLPPGPAFHRACWHAAQRIARGTTVSYGELAAMAGATSGAARAAGQAMRRNPVPIIVPCHRVIAASGGLGGFAGSDDPTSRALAIKLTLLRGEGVEVGMARN